MASGASLSEAYYPKFFELSSPVNTHDEEQNLMERSELYIYIYLHLPTLQPQLLQAFYHIDNAILQAMVLNPKHLLAPRVINGIHLALLLKPIVRLPRCRELIFVLGKVLDDYIDDLLVAWNASVSFSHSREVSGNVLK